MINQMSEALCSSQAALSLPRAIASSRSRWIPPAETEGMQQSGQRDALFGLEPARRPRGVHAGGHTPVFQGCQQRAQVVVHGAQLLVAQQHALGVPALAVEDLGGQFVGQ